MSSDKAVSTRFKKGQSGNPGGMTAEQAKKRQEMQLAALEHCPAALKELVNLLASADPRVRVVAANSILDRGLGKPAQAIAVSGEITRRDVRELTEEELERIAAGGSVGAAGAQTGETDDSSVH